LGDLAFAAQFQHPGFSGGYLLLFLAYGHAFGLAGGTEAPDLEMAGHLKLHSNFNFTAHGALALILPPAFHSYG